MDPCAEVEGLAGSLNIRDMEGGVVSGDVAWNFLKFAKARSFALPSFKCIESSDRTGVLEAADKVGKLAYIRFSEDGTSSSQASAKRLSNGKYKSAVLGACAEAHGVRNVAPASDIAVLVHADRCAAELLPCFDGELSKLHDMPLFSSPMLDVSEEPHEENVHICADYLTSMALMRSIHEMEIGSPEASRTAWTNAVFMRFQQVGSSLPELSFGSLCCDVTWACCMFWGEGNLANRSTECLAASLCPTCALGVLVLLLHEFAPTVHTGPGHVSEGP